MRLKAHARGGSRQKRKSNWRHSMDWRLPFCGMEPNPRAFRGLAGCHSVDSAAQTAIDCSEPQRRLLPHPLRRALGALGMTAVEQRARGASLLLAFRRVARVRRPLRGRRPRVMHIGRWKARLTKRGSFLSAGVQKTRSKGCWELGRRTHDCCAGLFGDGRSAWSRSVKEVMMLSKAHTRHAKHRGNKYRDELSALAKRAGPDRRQVASDSDACTMPCPGLIKCSLISGAENFGAAEAEERRHGGA
eukprot:1820200-Rhodomonas_salina.3